MSRSMGAHRLRGDESWVDISIQPTPTYSSVNNEIVTTGLQVRHFSLTNSRRRQVDPDISFSSTIGSQSTSSSEEYEESDSEEDHILTSSNEQLNPALSPQNPSAYDTESDSDKNKSSTSHDQGTNFDSFFTPQPNAFSHPPTSRRYRTPDNCFPNARYSYLAQSPSGRHSYNSPADHDAALRASLTTILSLGAATARSLPKRETATVGLNQACNGPMGLRLVSETEFMASNPRQESHISRPRSSCSAKNSKNESDGAFVERRKRKAIPAEKNWSSKRNQIDKNDDSFSPTLLTWTISAGVLVLISVVGFGAGYIIGRVAGRDEIVPGINTSGLSEGISSGREPLSVASDVLKRFKFGISGSSRSVFM